ncbi:MAG: sensor domain-containing diguanylate cyclase [Acidimicrobiales bacterium]|nr:sensor domain-containing diguanylate cyclase [Acidimicrobiales bacterium]
MDGFRSAPTNLAGSLLVRVDQLGHGNDSTSEIDDLLVNLSVSPADLTFMVDGGDPQTWSDHALVETFGACDSLAAFDATATRVAVPSALRDYAREHVETPWLEQLRRLHPDDRASAVQMWWDAIGNPCELQTLDARARVGDEWRYVRLRCVNLLQQPRVRAVVLGTTTGDVVGSEEATGRYRVPTWVYHELNEMAVITRIQGAVHEVFGQAPEALTGLPVMRVIHPEDHEIVTRLWVDVLSVPLATGVVRVRIVRPDGGVTWIESTLTNRLHEIGVVTVSSVEISDRLSHEGALRASQEEFRYLAEEMPVAVFRADPHGVVVYGNSRWFALDAEFGPCRRLSEFVHPDRRARFDTEWAEFVSGVGAETHEFEFPSTDGTRALSIHCRRVTRERGETIVIGLFEDVTAEAQLRRQADGDPLTGLLNRAALARLLDRSLIDGEEIVVAFIDLDDFKNCNDRFGHAVGDLVLQAVAERLVSAVRASDCVARYGGDEFVVLFRGSVEGSFDDVVDRLTEVVERPVSWADGSWTPRISVGTAAAFAGDNQTELLRRADEAMYDTKRMRRIARQAGTASTSEDV